MKKNLKLCMFLLALPSSSHGAMTFYEETFPYSGGGGNVSHSTVDWQFHDGSTATNQSTATANYAVSPGAGVGGVSGYGAANTSASISLAWTSEFTALDRSLTEISSISFASNNTAVSSTMRFAIRLGTTWYASADTFTNPSGGNGNNFATNGALASNQHELLFSTAAADWHLVDFTSGSTLSRTSGTLGSDLPSDNLTAAGILFESHSGNTIRYDNFKIETIPEPSSLVVASLGALVGFRRRR